MLAVAGYYDGANVQFLEQPDIKKNQRVIITIMNDFVEETTPAISQNLDRKNAAFQRLEAWRKGNKQTFEADFDWKQEVREALHEKYGIRILHNSTISNEP
ncbi:MAG: hypothetical protein IJ812_06525 [Schwartzia sp.]|nr:hypothetical protein [Schwartzia sp. (in: firmicutes)]